MEEQTRVAAMVDEPEPERRGLLFATPIKADSSTGVRGSTRVEKGGKNKITCIIGVWHASASRMSAR